MDFNRLVHEIDAEISRLQQVRTLLTGQTTKRPGRPKAASIAVTVKPAGRRRQRLSAEGRKRISEAMRKRWAERRRQQGSK